MASIGFTALEGQSSMAGMPARELPGLPDDSLEAVGTAPDRPLSWLNRERLQKLGVVTSRLFGKPTALAAQVVAHGRCVGTHCHTLGRVGVPFGTGVGEVELAIKAFEVNKDAIRRYRVPSS